MPRNGYRDATEASLLHAHGFGGVIGHGLGRVRCHDDRDAKLAIHAEQRMQKRFLRNGVKLGGRLVEEQDARLHGQDSRKGDDLLLAARKL